MQSKLKKNEREFLNSKQQCFVVVVFIIHFISVYLTVSCSSKIQIGFTFLVLAYPGCPGKEAVKWLQLSQYSMMDTQFTQFFILLRLVSQAHLFKWEFCTNRVDDGFHLTVHIPAGDVDRMTWVYLLRSLISVRWHYVR